jgi:hypothetical protein
VPGIEHGGDAPGCDRRVDPVVEAGDDDHLRRGRAERPRGVGSGELLVALEQGLIFVMTGTLS